MLRVLAALLFMCSPALAGGHGEPPGYTGFGSTYPVPPAIVTPENGYAYPGIGEGTTYSLNFVLTDELLGNVVFHNTLVSAVNTSDEFEIITDYGVVRVIIDSGAGDEPDLITVFPPAGFYATPNEILVPEDTTIIIEVREYILG